MSDGWSGGGFGGAGAPPTGAIEVTTSFFFMAFLLSFFATTIHIDQSAPIKHPWGTRTYPVAPGRHSVRVYCTYLFYPTMGDGTIAVDVAPGQVVRVTWRAPWLVFLTGSFSVDGAKVVGAVGTSNPFGTVQAPRPVAPPAGWYPDPQGQRAQRYWDGWQWTAHTADAPPV